MSSCRLKSIFLLLAVAFFSSPAAFAQLPFNTDDADTTEKGKFHFEFYNQHDWLQKTSLPAKRLNTSNFTLNYGLTDRVELGISVPVLKLINARESRLGDPVGVGDTQLAVKVRFRDEREGSRVPAITGAFYVKLPTGSAEKQIGSGLADYGSYVVIQKSLTKRTTARLNGGVVFAGNKFNGPIGIEGTRGQVFTGHGSLVRGFTSRLNLGVELFGGVSNNFKLSRGQLQTQVGGDYAVRENLTFTFGVLAGRFAASPSAGVTVGLAYDFK